MIVIKLREAMERYRTRTGERMTYERLSEISGLSRATLESIGSRLDYNTTLDKVDRLCEALGCDLDGLLERRSGRE